MTYGVYSAIIAIISTYIRTTSFVFIEHMTTMLACIINQLQDIEVRHPKSEKIT